MPVSGVVSVEQFRLGGMWFDLPGQAPANGLPEEVIQPVSEVQPPFVGHGLPDPDDYRILGSSMVFWFWYLPFLSA